MTIPFRRLPALFLSVVAVACGVETPPPAPPPESEVRRGVVLDNLRARVYNGERLEQVVQANRGVLDLDQEAVDLSSVRVEMNAENDLQAEMTCNEGRMFLADRPQENVAKNDLFLKGDVRFQDQRGTNIETPEVRYLSDEERIVSGGGWFRKRLALGDQTFLTSGTFFELTTDLRRMVDHGAQVRQLAPSGNGETQRGPLTEEADTNHEN